MRTAMKMLPRPGRLLFLALCLGALGGCAGGPAAASSESRASRRVLRETQRAARPKPEAELR